MKYAKIYLIRLGFTRPAQYSVSGDTWPRASFFHLYSKAVVYGLIFFMLAQTCLLIRATDESLQGTWQRIEFALSN